MSAVAQFNGWVRERKPIPYILTQHVRLPPATSMELIELQEINHRWTCQIHNNGLCGLGFLLNLTSLQHLSCQAIWEKKVLSICKKSTYWNNYFNIFFLQVNNSIHVNSVDVPDSDIMATNGVIHVVKNVLYPAGESSLHYIHCYSWSLRYVMVF